MNFLTAMLNPHRTGRRGSRLLEQLRSLRENGSSSVRFSRLLSRKLNGGQTGGDGSTRSFEDVREHSARNAGSGFSEAHRNPDEGGSPGSSTPGIGTPNSTPPPGEDTGAPPGAFDGESNVSPDNRSRRERGGVDQRPRAGEQNQSRKTGSRFRSTVRHLSETYEKVTSGSSSVEWTREERQLIRDIQQGDFQLDQPEDLRRLNRLLKKLSRAGDPASTRRGLELAELLFGGQNDSLESLEELLTQGETKRAREVLNELDTFLGRLKKLANRADRQITAIIDRQFKQSLRELGFKEPPGLTELLSQSSTAEKSGGGNSSGSVSTSSLAKTIDRLQEQIAGLRDRLNKSGQPPEAKKAGSLTGKVKSIWEQFTKQVRELFSRQEQNSKGSGRSGSNRPTDWVNRVLRQKLTQLQQRLEETDWKRKLQGLKNQNPVTKAEARNTESSPDNGTKNSSSADKATPGADDSAQTAKRANAGANNRETSKNQATKSQPAKSSSNNRTHSGQPAGNLGPTSPNEAAPTRRQPGSETTNSRPSNGGSTTANPTRARSQVGDHPSLHAIQQQLAEKTSPSDSSPPASAKAGEGAGAVLQDAVSGTGASKQAGDPGVERGLSSSKEGPKMSKMVHYEANSARPASASSGSSGSGERGNQQGLSRQTNPAFRANRSSLSQRSAEARRIIDQIVQRARTMVEEGKQTMRLQLKPEALGTMKLEVSVEAGTVSANFQVEKSPVKQALNNHVNQLKQTLQQIGVEVDQIDISDMSTQTEEGGADWFEPETGPRGVRGGGAGEENEGEVEAAEADASGRIYLREYSTFEHVA